MHLLQRVWAPLLAVGEFRWRRNEVEGHGGKCGRAVVRGGGSWKKVGVGRWVIP